MDLFMKIAEWKINSGYNCLCHLNDGSRIDFAEEPKVKGNFRLRGLFGCNGGEEITFSLDDGIVKAKEFIETYTQEGMLTIEAGQEVLKRISKRIALGLDGREITL